MASILPSWTDTIPANYPRLVRRRRFFPSSFFMSPRSDARARRPRCGAATALRLGEQGRGRGGQGKGVIRLVKKMSGFEQFWGLWRASPSVRRHRHCCLRSGRGPRPTPTGSGEMASFCTFVQFIRFSIFFIVRRLLLAVLCPLGTHLRSRS